MALSHGFSFYWNVNGSIAGSSEVWSAMEGDYVATSDADYVAWLALGNTVGVIATEAELWVELARRAHVYYTNSGAGNNVVTASGSSTSITNPVPDVFVFTPSSAGQTLTLPRANTVISRPVSRIFYIRNGSGSESFQLIDFIGGGMGTFPPNSIYMVIPGAAQFEIASGLGDQLAHKIAILSETGTGGAVYANTPTLVTPILGTPTSGTLTNCTIPVGGVSGLGTGVGTFLATPSSANLRSALTDETGTGVAVFADAPTLTSPVVGTQSAQDASTKAASTAYADRASALRGHIAGLTLSAAGGTGTFGIAAGEATDSGQAAVMKLASAYTKTTSSWAVGTGNGALDTGSISATATYTVWLIQRSDTGVVDVLVSTSATAPTMPTNYDRKRRIGWMFTDGSSHWTKFIQVGETFWWDVQKSDVATAAQDNTRMSWTLSAPRETEAIIDAIVYRSGSVSTFLFTSLDQTDTTPSASVTYTLQGNDSVYASGELRIRTDASRQIGVRSLHATNNLLYINTRGWVDHRGRFD